MDTPNDVTQKLVLEALRLEGKPFHRGGVTFQRCLLPIGLRRDQVGVYEAEAQRLFLPRGLAVWNAPPGTMVDQIVCGAQLQAVASYGRVPARFFAFGDSYEQIAKKLDEGSEPPNWCDWDPVGVGCRVRLIFSDAAGTPLPPSVPLELAMWGIAAL